VGILNRGIESFFREAFDGLKNISGLDVRLIKGASDGSNCDFQERIVWCLKRTGKLALLIGRLTGRTGYAVEQWSSFPGVIREIRRFRPNVVFTSEANLMFLLRRFRRQIGVQFRVLYSNGGPVHPPFDRHDFVHQVAPFYFKEALDAGEPSGRHFMIPYGIKVSETKLPSSQEKSTLRIQLALPLDRKIIISVGWISSQHKRMDYLIREVSKLPEPRPFLQLLGAIDESSTEVIDLGNHLLGPNNFSVLSVPYCLVGNYYKAADCFVLASLSEGFGRVYIEALMHGLPVIGHSHPVIEFVLGDVGIISDLSLEGNLSNLLNKVLKELDSSENIDKSFFLRRDSVFKRFSWDVLQSQYLEMFRAVSKADLKIDR
jgi:glycosyltransferase involved in cell wall biosynthesis